MGHVNQSWFSSNTDEWGTPIKVFEELNKEFHFTLDPCASNLNHKCNNYYTIDTDGLAQNWGGQICFVNPPYSKMKDWAKKCYEESLKPSTTVVLLMPARTDTSYFHDYVYPYAELRFIRGRLRYNDCKRNAPFPSVICVYKRKDNNESIR